MPIQQMLLGSGSGPDLVDTLAEFFNVSPTTSTNVKLEFLAANWSWPYQQPTQANSWQQNPSSTTNGCFISGIWKTDVDNVGMWREGNTNTNMGEPAGVVPTILSSSGGDWNASYNISNAVSTPTNGNNGGYTAAAYGVADGNSSAPYAVFNWSGGLGNAKGFKVQFWREGGNNIPYHHTGVMRFTIGSTSRTYAPKGVWQSNANTSSGTSGGRGGVVFYPTIYDDTTTTALSNHFGANSGITGTTLPSNLFVY